MRRINAFVHVLVGSGIRNTGWVKNKFTHLVGYGLKSMRPIFKIEMLIYQLKAN